MSQCYRIFLVLNDFNVNRVISYKTLILHFVEKKGLVMHFFEAIFCLKKALNMYSLVFFLSIRHDKNVFWTSTNQYGKGWIGSGGPLTEMFSPSHSGMGDGILRSEKARSNFYLSHHIFTNYGDKDHGFMLIFPPAPRTGWVMMVAWYF